MLLHKVLQDLHPHIRVIDLSQNKTKRPEINTYNILTAAFMEMRIRAASNKKFNTKNARFIWITFTVFTYFLKLENVDCVDFQWIDKNYERILQTSLVFKKRMDILLFWIGTT